MTTLIERSQITPPSGDVPPEISLPMTFLDIPWILSPPLRQLLFYSFPCSRSDFLKTHLPELKESLSITLKYYTPVAGNLLLYSPTTSKKPEIRYLAGEDSLSLGVFESVNDFDKLIAHGLRDADELYDYVPQFPAVRDESEFLKIVPLAAMQITLFPGKGVCIGFSNQHSLGDASSVVSFIKTWASVNKQTSGAGDGDEDFIFPCFDRSLIKDPSGIDAIYWNQIKKIPFRSPISPFPTKRFRSSYILNPSEIKKLKDFITARHPDIIHLSSFSVATAYAWTILAKSGDVIGEPAVDERFFLFPGDARALLNPEVPANYFGNCLSYGFVCLKHSELVSEDGFVIAAEAIAERIKNKVTNKERALENAENSMTEIISIMGRNVLGVSGSPRFDLYGVDFGWGKAVKIEAVSIDEDEYSISLSKTRDFNGGLEIGLSLPKPLMEAFHALFAHGFTQF